MCQIINRAFLIEKTLVEAAETRNAVVSGELNGIRPRCRCWQGTAWCFLLSLLERLLLFLVERRVATIVDSVEISDL